MNRRRFLNTGASLASLFYFAGSNSALALPTSKDLDLDAVAKPLWRFEDLLPHLTPLLEKHFDMIFFVNTSEQQPKGAFVIGQHMRVVLREEAGVPLFTRDEKGVVNGLAESASIWGPGPGYPVSTGFQRPATANDGAYILTYSGIFRFNHRRSIERLDKSPTAYMSHSLYIDYVYASGREAGVALHGTNMTEYEVYLGNQRSSKGCIMYDPQYAESFYEQLMAPKMWSNNLPEFDRKLRYPAVKFENGKVKTRPGIKALMFIFNGYRNPVHEGFDTTTES